MGKLIFLMACFVTMSANAEGIRQEQKDAIREHYEKQILGSGKDITIRQPDVELYRKIFAKPNQLDTRVLTEPDEIPWAQIFKGQDLTLGQILKLASAAGGYDAEFDPQVDQNEIIKLNTNPNSLVDIAEYLTRVSKARVTVYPEYRVLVTTKKVSTNG